MGGIRLTRAGYQPATQAKSKDITNYKLVAGYLPITNHHWAAGNATATLAVNTTNKTSPRPPSLSRFDSSAHACVSSELEPTVPGRHSRTRARGETRSPAVRWMMRTFRRGPVPSKGSIIVFVLREDRVQTWERWWCGTFHRHRFAQQRLSSF